MESSRLSLRAGIGLGSTRSLDLAPGPFFDLIETIEALGYDSLWLSDSATLGGPAPLPTLAAVAARTRKLKLGTNVLVAPPRNPVLLAKELATVSALSGGRLLPAFGLGIDLGREAEAMGVPRGERAARTEEAIEIVRALWPGEPVTYAGRFTTITDVTLAPRPAQDSLDVWLGGSSPAALRRTGRLADGWLGSFVSPDELRDCVGAIVEAAAEAGRQIDDDHYGTTLFAAPDADEVPAELAALLRRRPELPVEDHLALGAEALRVLLDRFVEAGASKFVVVPIADDLPAWLEELREAAIAPFEHQPA
jgi:probable F420-dependent oxidoreductase